MYTKKSMMLLSSNNNHNMAALYEINKQIIDLMDQWQMA